MSTLGRAREIAGVVWREGLYELLELVQLPWLPRVLCWPLRWLPEQRAPLPERCRAGLEQLGPVFIKFGQLLSTRRDLLAPAYADELALLQDAVPPFDGAAGAIAAELGNAPDALFSEFDPVALASASVAQVHAARLRDGTEVCVKVLRPQIEVVIERDLALLKRLARAAEALSVDARRLRLPEVVADYEATILGELDLRREAAQTQRLRLNFADSPLLYVPRVYSEFSTARVLTLERVFAAPMGNLDAIRAAGTDMALLAERGVTTFFTQVFEHNFFHADMHPGNIFVDITDPRDPSWIAIDCAIMGELSALDRLYLARNLLAFLDRDYTAVARLAVEAGWIPADTDLAALTDLIAAVCDPVYDKPLAEIEFGQFLVTLFTAAREFRLEVQPQLVLLQKTLLNIEGLGRQLYPELDLWSIARPFMRRWMAQQVGPAALLEGFSAEAPQLLRQLPQLPATLAALPFELQRLIHLTSAQNATLAQLQAELTRNRRRWRMAVLVAIAIGLLALD